MPQEAMALVQAFSELVPGVPCDEETLGRLIAHFWTPHAILRHEPEENLVMEIEHHTHYKRKRGGETELVEDFVSFYFFLLLAPHPNNYRPRRVLYRGQVNCQCDTEAFLHNLMEMRRILRLVRAGGLCSSCGERLKVERASLCAPCACKAFWK